MTTAAILIHLDGVARHKQEAACLDYCANKGYRTSTLVFQASDGLELIRARVVDVIVTAYLPADESSLVADVAEVGGRLERARQSSRFDRAIAALIARLDQRGMTVAEISEVIEAPTGDIREELSQVRRRRRN